jgi:hypothetical protein
MEGLAAIDQFERFQGLAGLLHMEARASGANVRFMATRVGILAVEASPKALTPKLIEYLSGRFRRVEARSDSREILALTAEPGLAGPFIGREAEKECRAVLERGPIDVCLFINDELPVVDLAAEHSDEEDDLPIHVPLHESPTLAAQPADTKMPKNATLMDRRGWR